MLEQAIAFGLFEARKWTPSQTAANRKLGKTIRGANFKGSISPKSRIKANTELQKRLNKKAGETFNQSLRRYDKTGKRDMKAEKTAGALYTAEKRLGYKRLGQKEKKHVFDDSPSDKSKMVDKRGKFKKWLDRGSGTSAYTS